MTDRSRGGIFAGILVLGLGLVLLVMQFVPQVRALDLWSLFPLVIGIAFLTGYGFARQYGFLIPGCILTGLGLGALTGQLVPGGLLGVDATAAGLGIGFLAIYPIDLAVRGREPGQWWPLVPGGIILMTGVAPALWQDFWQVAPAVALIVIGVVILARAFMPGASERSAEREARRSERRARGHGGDVPAAPPASPAGSHTKATIAAPDPAERTRTDQTEPPAPTAP